MKTVHRLVIIVIFSIFSLTAGFSEGSLRKVVIDAGHGGKDPGTLNSKYKEKDIVLKIALKVGEYIKRNFKDIAVVYTRETNTFVELIERARIANEAKADLFISIHVNASSNPKIYGTSTYVLGLHRSEDNLKVAMRENSVILQEEDYSTKYEGFDPNEPESYIIFNLLQNQYLENSMIFANFIENQFQKRAKRHSLGVRQAGFAVLREVAMPSVLVETGFMTNSTESNYLASSRGQDLIASGIYRAFKEYKKYVDENSASIIKGNPDEVSSSASKESSTDTYFAIQILSSSQKVAPDSKVFKGLKPIDEHHINNMYKYTYGKTSLYPEIENLWKSVKKKVKDCFIVGFHEGKRISAKETRNIIEKNE